MRYRKHIPILARLPVVGALALAAPAVAQVTVSVDYQSLSISMPDGFTAAPITEGDLLAPNAPGPLPTLGPLPPPGIWISGGMGPPGPGLMLALHPPCQGHPPGLACGVEVDALSYGRDFNLDPVMAYMPGANLWFSADRFAVGVGTPFVPDLASEALAAEAAADAFVEIGLIPGPLPPLAMPAANTGAIDGDGLALASPFLYPGLGLIEPSPPGLGDDVDALDVQTPFLLPSVFFSLDASYVDPLTGLALGASAARHGFVGGDVAWTPMLGMPPALFAAAAQLGLDLVGGPDTDDLDALILWENGDFVFTPSKTPYDWATGATDMLLFSVRRGSAVIGAPDSMFGIPIEEGDLLTTPLAGGLSPFPAIFVAAENLGLSTVRSGGGPFGDDLDGADSAASPTLDCDGNGIEDAVDIALGLAPDCNSDGVPDPCQLVVSPYCFGALCPCGNLDLAAGCANSTGVGALMTASGSSVHCADDLVLTTSQMPPNQFGMTVMGPTTGVMPFVMDGRLCVGAGALGIFRYPPQSIDASGSFTLGPGIVALACGTFNPNGCIQPGQTWRLQTWYRDPKGPCGFGSNLSNAIAVTFLP